MNITVNGKPRFFSDQLTLRELLRAQSVDPAHVVVEINGTIIAKDAYDAVSLAANDCLEILRFVGVG
jgi:sulfur carrier protein